MNDLKTVSGNSVQPKKTGDRNRKLNAVMRRKLAGLFVFVVLALICLLIRITYINAVSGKQYMSHVYIMNEAVRIGFYPKDLFSLRAKSRLVADWQKRNQRNSRKYHSYFWVFQKNNRRIEYA